MRGPLCGLLELGHGGNVGLVVVLWGRRVPHKDVEVLRFIWFLIALIWAFSMLHGIKDDGVDRK